jgi:endoribonuclease Dicer
MKTEFLAKQIVALQTVIVLHHNGELDDNLAPIGKEGVLPEPDLSVVQEPEEEEEYGEFRPGSTKRRQYYDKKIADELLNCLPDNSVPMYLYWIQMVLTCPLPEEQNTRGRKLHPPELCLQSFGILLAKEIELLPAFPIYTRCGEVQVQLVRVPSIDRTQFTLENLEKISTFHHYTFTSVLRLDKYLTLFDPILSENSYYVVPLRAVEFDRHPEGIVDLSSRIVDIDWSFLNTIWETRNCTRPVPVADEDRKDYTFRKEDYEDAVVMPWYRSHDAPQYFYVAEICSNLTPKSQFPGIKYCCSTFICRFSYDLFL